MESFSWKRNNLLRAAVIAVGSFRQIGECKRARPAKHIAIIGHNRLFFLCSLALQCGNSDCR